MVFPYLASEGLGSSNHPTAPNTTPTRRLVGVNLARLKHHFSDAYVGEEPYFKVEQVLPVRQLSSLQDTYCPMEYKAMLQVALVIFRFYQEVAPVLAEAHGIKYQTELETNDVKPTERVGWYNLELVPLRDKRLIS